MFLFRGIDIKLCQIYTKIHTILYKSSRFKQIIFSKYATNLKTTISQRSLNATNWVAKILGLEKAELVAIPTISNWFIHQLTHLSLRPVQFVETWFKFKLNISVIFKSRKVRSLNVVNPRFLEIILYWRPSLQLQRWKSNSRGYPVPCTHLSDHSWRKCLYFSSWSWGQVCSVHGSIFS